MAALWQQVHTEATSCHRPPPHDKRFEKRNVYHVVEGLLGANEAQQLRQLHLAPQQVRSGHLHRGELVGGELVQILMQSYFGDPSFDMTLSVLTQTTRACLIEWLRCGGRYTLKRPRATAPHRKWKKKP